ncbi:MAG: hypothetical protein M3Y35_09675 [Actinomycetota bacterium]|nr:hypothetical protein [Actinomycetota bacterium]
MGPSQLAIPFRTERPAYQTFLTDAFVYTGDRAANVVPEVVVAAYVFRRQSSSS